MEKLLDFYLRLSQNNNKPWFDAHRPEYEETKGRLAAVAEDFIAGIAQFDPRCKDLQVKDCTYRINRDIRFSKDKRPYKDWHGIYVCPRGKKSGMAGYYIHFEPASDLFFVSAGLYNPTKEVLASVREQIMLEPEEFDDAVKACGEGFQLDWNRALRRMPKGFSEGDKHSEYYKLRSYEIIKRITRHDVLAQDFIPKALQTLSHCHTFNELLNKCYEYAYDTDR